jgi:hypothetical protein
MGLYERLLEERTQEERRRGRPLGAFYGLDSPVLDRRLAEAPKDRPSGYATDLSTMRRLITEGPRGHGDAYRFHGLKRRYREEHAELAAEAGGQGEFPKGRGLLGPGGFVGPRAPRGSLPSRELPSPPRKVPIGSIAIPKEPPLTRPSRTAPSACSSPTGSATRP